MNEKALVTGSTLAALVASLCCLGPLVLGGLGLGAVLVSTFAPLRPYFLSVSAVLLALGFYFAYRKPRSVEVCEGEVCVADGRARGLAKSMLWVGAVAVAALALFPYYGASLVRLPKAQTVAATAALSRAELRISGMDCEACAGVVHRSLLEVPGVAEAQVDFAGGRATIQYDRAQANPAALIAAVEGAGYRATVEQAKGGD